MRDEAKREVANILWQLDQIDDLSWQRNNNSDVIEDMPETEKWINKIGESDSKGNWKFPAELIARDDTETKRIKSQRSLVGQMRMIFRNESALVNEPLPTYRGSEERDELIENLKWAKRFGLDNLECAFVLGEKLDYIVRLSSKMGKDN